MSQPSSRSGIYYWKCDRAAAFHGTAQGTARQRPELAEAVRALVSRHFGRAVESLRDGGGQGNHLTFLATVAGRDYFVRIEDGPEADDYLAVESHVMAQVRRAGVPVPEVYASDANRAEHPFAWQILEYLPQPDLNRHFKAGTLDSAPIAKALGGLIARWQSVPVTGFGPFDVISARAGRLQGLLGTYPDYHFTRLAAHLRFLVERKFLTAEQVHAIEGEFERHRALLDLSSGCLVHKDLALWNVLGTESRITAVIDWDDCISGDPMDDLALLGCFHDGAFLRAAFEGYAEVRPLPVHHERRFWLHLLRNMIFKAVIRVGAGYFDRDGSFFLVGAGAGGTSLREQTLARIAAALDGLRRGREIFSL